MANTQRAKEQKKLRNHLTFTLDNLDTRRRGTIMPLMRHGTLGEGLSPRKMKDLKQNLNKELNIYNQKSVMSKLTNIVAGMNNSPENYKQMKKKYAKATSKLNTNIDNIQQMKTEQKANRLKNQKKEMEHQMRSA